MPETRPTIGDRRSPTDVAANLVKEKYPEALLAFVGGSFNRGETTAFSDIDLVVVFQKLDHAWRESFTFQEWPVEVFAHDLETLRYFFELDAQRGVLMLPSMIMEGPASPPDHPLLNEIKCMAQNALHAQPSLWDDSTLASKRYAITDLVNDLRDPRSRLEASATIGALHAHLGDFYFRARGVWSASNKQIPRRLAQISPALFLRWEDAFLQAWQGHTKRLIEMAEEILNPYGGFLFDGYRLDAPSNWRVTQ